MDNFRPGYVVVRDPGHTTSSGARHTTSSGVAEIQHKAPGTRAYSSRDPIGAPAL